MHILAKRYLYLSINIYTWKLLFIYVSENIFICFFSIRFFFQRHWRFSGQQKNGVDHHFCRSTTSTRSQAFKHFFATLHVRWLSHVLIAPLVFTRLLLDEIYHLIELPFDWFIDDAMFVYLLDGLSLDFCCSDFDIYILLLICSSGGDASIFCH